METWQIGMFIRAEFTVVSKGSRCTVTEVSPKSIPTCSTMKTRLINFQLTVHTRILLRIDTRVSS